MALVPRLLFGILLAADAYAALYQVPTSAILNKKYDYIIVGGGAAGSVLGRRLSETASKKVLVIEAGSSDYLNMDIRIVGDAGLLGGSQFDWNFTTQPMPDMDNRSIPYARGKVLGGSTAINFMAYSRGSEDDFNRYASVTGDSGWSWNSIFPYFLKTETLTYPTDGRSVNGELNKSLHGTNGPVGTSVTNMLLPTDSRVLNTTQELPQEFPFNLDYNSGNTIGVSWIQFTMHDAERSSAGLEYLQPVFNRSNLDILVNTQVTKILKTGTSGGQPVMRGVQFAQSAAGPFYTLNATTEVILSAGAIQTPQLLLLSGIGPKATLNSFNIPVLVNSPDVGQNLQDHPLVTNTWSVNAHGQPTFDALIQNATFASDALAQWEANRTGFLSLGAGNQWAWLRVPPTNSIWQGVKDPSAGPKSSHYEFILYDGFISFASAFPTSGTYWTVFTNVISPASRGNLTLATTNPFDAPLIQPNFYSADIDLLVMREAIKSARAFMAADAWDDYVIEEFGDFANAQTDEQIEAYARATSSTVNHVTCTCAMGKTNSLARGDGVLNPNLTVKGVRGLRVVDASAFPFIPAAHPQVATYALAERASDLIKAGR